MTLLINELVQKALKDYRTGDALIRADIRRWIGDATGTIVLVAAAYHASVSVIQEELTKKLDAIDQEV